MKQFNLCSIILLPCFLLFSLGSFSQSDPPVQVLNQAEKPHISTESGFYKKPFDVIVSTGMDGMEIYYTLNGSDPATSRYKIRATSPVKIHIDPQSYMGRGRTPGVILRAAAKSDLYSFSPIATKTYLFIDNINLQTSSPGNDWPTSGYYTNSQAIDLLMDSRILTDPVYGEQMRKALLQIPSISIATDNQNLFSSSSGIYVNAMDRGLEWEVPASVELINPDGSEGFQIDAGLRIRGGYSRNGSFRKHAFRLFFRSEYGAAKLDFPLFGDEGVKSFDKIDLRCSQNYSWSKGGSEAPFSTFTRDVFSRDAQGLMNQEYTRSRYYHLYINGLYWGLYQSQERPEASFAADYMGGDQTDYDVIKRAGETETIEATDGTLDNWREVWDMCQQGFADNAYYYRIQGLNENGVRDPNIKVLVDIDNLIDYMNIIFYTGNFDAPASSFFNNKSPNNFYAIYNKNDDRGFTFMAHDNEHTLLAVPVPDNPNYGITENRVNIGSITSSYKMEVSSFSKFHPQWLHFKLSQNAEYRQRFSDRAYRLYYNNGIFTPEKAAALFKNRNLEIDTAVIAESARWGDVTSGILRTKADWTTAVDQTINDFFPYRTDIVIKQLQDEGLLSTIDAPTFKLSGKDVVEENITLAPGEAITIGNPNETGNISYTLDGSDPRLAEGNISQKSANGGNSASISVFQSCTINARIFDNGAWSPLHTINFSIDPSQSSLLVSEINYNPLGDDGISGSELEFLELKNNGVTPTNLTGASFIQGIDFSFDTETFVDPGKFIVLASNSLAFKQRYGFAPNGEYEGQLDNKGEQIMLVNAVGDTIINMSYNDKEPWAISADGLGFTLVPSGKNIGADWNDGLNWRSSTAINGSPGADDNEGIEIPKILINEILANSEAPQTDAIELFNQNNTAINISGWYLSDKQSSPKKWKIPEGSIIPANGFLVFKEGHYEGGSILYSNSEFGSSFSLSSHGENIYLFSASASGDLTGYQTGFAFEATDPGVSFGRHINSIDKIQFVAQQTNTFNSVNSLPKVGPVIINQIMYNPDESQYEYIELVNISSEKIDLFDETLQTPWRISGIDFIFPENISINPGESVYLIEGTITPADFRTIYSLDESVQVFNYSGKLKNEGETVAILKSYQSEYKDGALDVPYIVIDQVDYNDNQDWPDADGNGKALQRISHNSYGNDPAGWTTVSPSLRIKSKLLPDALEGISYSKELTALGGLPPYNWSVAGDGLPTGLTLNPESGIIDGKPAISGTFNLNIKVEDSANESREVNLSLIVQENTAPIAYNDTISGYRNHTISYGPYYKALSECIPEIVSQTKHGTVMLTSDHVFNYIPEKDYMGLDSMVYRVTNAKGSSEATVFINTIDDTPLVFTYSFINKAQDDAEENLSTSKINLGHPTLEMPYDPQLKANQIVGLRFQNLQVPEGAEIADAYIYMYTGKSDTAKATLTVKGEASITPASYSASSLLSTRPATKTSITWHPEAFQGATGMLRAYTSADIGPIVQEIIDMGWQSGGAMAFMITGEGEASRTIYSYNAGYPAALIIEYKDPNAVPVKPVAVISPTSAIGKGSQVAFSAQGSSSPDGRPLSYYWELKSKPEGSKAEITNPYLYSSSFLADEFGSYEISLKVNNGVMESDETTITLVAANVAPIANAGADQIYKVGSTVWLNGSNSTDADGDNLTYQWQWINKPEGSKAVFTSSTEAKPSFVADVAGIYLLSLTVSDPYTQSEPKIVEFTVIPNQTPTADAGTDIQSVTGAVVVLDGSKSSDPDGDKLTFNWSIFSKPEGSVLSLEGLTNSKPLIQPDVTGEYVIHLFVSDGTNTSASDEVKVKAIKNLAPVAIAGEDILTTEHLNVLMDGSQSYDPEGKSLFYQWSFVSKPMNSNASIQNGNSDKPIVLTDTEGIYALKLKVSDGTFTAEDFVQISADMNTSSEIRKIAEKMYVYPNPFSNKLSVSYTTQLNQRIEFRLINISGTLIKNFVFHSSGQETHELNLSDIDLPAGMYLLVMKPENGETITTKLMHK